MTELTDFQRALHGALIPLYQKWKNRLEFGVPLVTTVISFLTTSKDRREIAFRILDMETKLRASPVGCMDSSLTDFQKELYLAMEPIWVKYKQMADPGVIFVEAIINALQQPKDEATAHLKLIETVGYIIIKMIKELSENKELYL